MHIKFLPLSVIASAIIASVSARSLYSEEFVSNQLARESSYMKNILVARGTIDVERTDVEVHNVGNNILRGVNIHGITNNARINVASEGGSKSHGRHGSSDVEHHRQGIYLRDVIFV